MMYHDRKKGKYKTRTGMIVSNEERDKNIVKYIEAGMKVSDVAKLTKVRSSVVMRIFNKNNGVLPEPPKWNIEEAVKMNDDGETYYAIGQYFGICNKMVKKRIVDYRKKNKCVKNLKLGNVKRIGFMGMTV